MEFKKFSIPIVLLAFIGSNSALVVPTQHSQEDFLGYNLEWTYLRKDTAFYFITNQASADIPSRGRFKYTQVAGGKENERNIQIHGSFDYLGVTPDGTLYVTTYSTCFVPVPAIGSPDNDKFYLHSCLHNAPLVTPNTHPPFQFYVQSRYPDEPPAIFRLAPYVLNVSEIYKWKRENIVKTLELIRDMDPLSRDSAYAELVSLMSTSGHLIGKEVFRLGMYIFQDTGVDSQSFQSLPKVVQSIISGGPLRLMYSLGGMQNASMKGHRTYDEPDYVLPYTITGDLNGERWAITYGINEQLGHFSNGVSLTALVSTDKNYQFRLHLRAGRNKIELHTDRQNSGRYYPLESKRYSSSPPGYYFVNEGKTVTTEFIVLPYVLDVAEMYGGVRENVIKTADFIQNNLTDVDDVDRVLSYEQLLSHMTQNYHVEGIEIFELGQYILEDFGNSSVPFRLLPPTVQLILNGGTISLSLENGGNYPMKYTWASDDHENIRPFTFEFSKINYRGFAITYSEDFQWLFSEIVHAWKLTEIKSMAKQYVFDLYLAADLQGIHIRCKLESDDDYYYYSLASSTSKPEFFFVCFPYDPNYDFDGALFSVKAFD